jgi:hypothetical protein
MPRWVHKIYAFLNGYFWMPCPTCGEMFGGHETKLSGIKITERGETWTRGKCICDRCTEKGLSDL